MKLSLLTSSLGLLAFACLPGHLYAVEPPHAAPASVIVKSGQKIGFMGDSITAMASGSSGYITLVVDSLKAEGIEVTPVKAGHSGDHSGNMAGRLEHDVLSQGVDWMTLSCGVNDINLPSGKFGVLDHYKKNVTAIVQAAKAKNVKVILLTPTPLGEDPQSPKNQTEATYIQFLKDYAKEQNLPLADVNAAFWEVIKVHPEPIGVRNDQHNQGRLIADGLHPNPDGQKLMAEVVLLTLGVPKADLTKIEESWPKGPSPRVKPDVPSAKAPKKL